MDDFSKGSCGKEKLKPMRGCLKSKAKPSANLVKSSMDMESTSSKELLSLGIAMDDLSKGSCGKEKLKPMRVRLKSKAKPSANLVKSSMDMESTSSKELLSGSSRREKLKPIRSRLNTTHREVKPPNKVAESMTDMDSMSLKDMLSGDVSGSGLVMCCNCE
ncbi:hypothetical protein L7F22_028602 [Adiantum nelumboides]|nr:hypothetical protein [Adiantum nelumboides]